MRAARDVDSLIAAEWSLEDLGAAQRTAQEPKPPARDPAAEREAAERAEAERTAEEEREREAEVERRIAAAYEQGFEDGREAGETAEAARLRNVVQVAELALDEIREGEVRWAGAIEENICALAVAVARQVIGRELSSDQAAVVDLVRRALAEFPIDQPIRIRVNPQDLSTLQSTGGTDGGGPAFPQKRDARWVADARMAPGGCLVEGRDRIVDGRIDTALERIYRRLTYAHV